MDKEVILENEYMTIWFYNTKKILHHEFHQFAYGKDLQNALSEGAAALEKNNIAKWLSDDRKNPALRKEDMDWTATVWRPRIIKAGLKYWAIVLPEKMAGQMAMKRIVEAYAETGVSVKMFGDADKALQWLESQ